MERTITMGGKPYTVTLKMGSIRLLKEKFNKEFEEIKSMNDMTELIYCCALCAARNQRLDFGFTIDEVADALDLGQVAELFTSLVQESGIEVGGAKQKKRA